MKNFRKSIFQAFGSGLLVFLFAFSALAQQIQRSPFDVTNYVMDVQLVPAENKLNATVDVGFTPLEDTRTVTFELNGSLKVENITLQKSATTTPLKGRSTTSTAQSQVTFVQDQVGVSDLGPSVKVDLGDVVRKGTPVTLRFKYNGVLTTPQGGPLLTKRLASVGTNNGYLMYAARWFPFHNYAADQATSDISISLPGGFQLVGFSDAPVSQSGGKYRFVQSKPALIGNFAYGKYTNKTLRFGDFELQFYTKPGNDAQVAVYGETLGRALDYYAKQYGEPQGGKRLVIAQIDDESLDFYSTQGMIFMADRLFEQSRDITQERLQREAALQWWGLTVGLKSFDDAWLSQGLAEYSAFSLRENQLSGAQLDNLRRELLEKSLTFEQTASLARTPATLDDQSIAYQYIMYAKGAFVFKLLRDTLGEQKFNQLLKIFLQQYRGKNASIDDFEKLATQVAGTNMRYFFARWVEGTGVPEFQADYQIIRTRGGKFVTRGTVKQNYDNLRLPVEVQLRSEGEGGNKIVKIDVEDASADFNIESNGKPLGVIIDPNYKLLRISPDLRISSIARRGIEQFKEGNYVEAQQQFEAALKLDRSNSWIYYHLGLLFLEQRNYDLAIDNFKAVLGGNLSPAWLAVWANIKMGNGYDAKGDRARAIAAYKRAEALGDNYDNAQNAVKKYQATPYDPKEKQNTTAVK
ncbi:MAG: tetratricopeptide repeat protein [Acidobacteria bacterium]|nr:tetratricopeptide repeat protein [Acidobacteriota bacterium]MCA1639655.1 tetratricopeptide repeat protein [Acidobacteriota bacterium]